MADDSGSVRTDTYLSLSVGGPEAGLVCRARSLHVLRGQGQTRLLLASTTTTTAAAAAAAAEATAAATTAAGEAAAAPTTPPHAHTTSGSGLPLCHLLLCSEWCAKCVCTEVWGMW
jgi:hypothetical protein